MNIISKVDISHKSATLIWLCSQEDLKNENIMNKLEEALNTYTEEFKNKVNIEIDQELLKKVTKGLGPSIYNKDASKVSNSDKAELETVKKNFLIKKLGLEDGPHLDEAIEEVMGQMGASNRNKYRAMVYYLLTVKFNKEAIYN